MTHDDLVEHLVRTSPLTRGDAARIVADVLAYFAESPDEYVRRRHHQLRAQGLHNAQIFGRIVGELSERRFAAPELSERQLRRIVYG